MRRSELACLALAAFLFLAATLPWISNLGLEYDEAHFHPLASKLAFGSEERLNLPWGFTVAHRAIPFVTMPYVGTLDAVIYAVPFRLFGTSPIVTRSTNIAVSLCIFALAYWIARREAGPTAALLTLGLLLVDVELVLHMPTGFGPFLLQQLLALAAIACLQQWWRTGGATLFFLAVALLALAFHEKLTFIWVLGSLAPAILLFRARLTWQQARWWYFPAGLLLAILIVSPILYFAWAVPEVILGFGKQSTKMPSDWGKILADRWHVFDLMLRGTWSMDFTVGPPPSSVLRGPALLILFGLGLLATLYTRQRLALTLYTTAIGVWVWNLAFPDAGRMHHLLLMAPFWQVAAAIAISQLALPPRALTLAFLLWAGFDATRAYGAYITQTKATGGINHWSDMTTHAGDWLAQHPELDALTPNWGIDRSIYILSRATKLPREFYFQTLTEPLSPETQSTLLELLAKDRQVWLVSDVMPIYEQQWQRVVRLAATLGRQPRLVNTFPSRNQLQHIRAYRFDNPTPQLTLRFQLNSLAEKESDDLTVEWLDADGKVCLRDSRSFYWTPHLAASSRFEFTPNYWPPTFRRQRLNTNTPASVRIQSNLNISNQEVIRP
jgi:hypothetical protein